LLKIVIFLFIMALIWLGKQFYWYCWIIGFFVWPIFVGGFYNEGANSRLSCFLFYWVQVFPGIMQHYFVDCEMWILISISKFDRGKHSSSGVNHPPNRYSQLDFILQHFGNLYYLFILFSQGDCQLVCKIDCKFFHKKKLSQ
jgi:hypothetical protein